MRKNNILKIKIFIFFILFLIIISISVLFHAFQIINNQLDEVDNQSNGSILKKSENIITSNGNITGIGNSASVNLTCNKSAGPFSGNSNGQFEIDIPNNWNINYTHIAIDNIRKASEILIVEEDTRGTDVDEDEIIFAMEFTLNTLAKLKNISFYLAGINDVRFQTLTAYIYNSTLQDSDPAPDYELYNEIFTEISNAMVGEWIILNFSSLIDLNPTNTYDNSFFIGFKANYQGGGNFQFGIEDDIYGDDGAGYRFNGTHWELKSWDFNLKVGLIDLSRNASEVNLKINTSSIQDKGNFNGVWNSSNTYSNDILFEFSANELVIFNFEWECTFYSIADSQVNTNFLGFADQNSIYWNATFPAFFIYNSYNKRLTFNLPIWDSVLYIRRNQVLHSQWNQSLVGSRRIITINNAINATWVIQCNDTNYVEDVTLLKNGELVSEVIASDTIEIIGNFTSILSSGDANLTIYPQEANYSDLNGEEITNHESIKFNPNWTIIDTAIGEYTEAKIQIIWFNGTNVGIRLKNLTINPIPSNLTYLSHTNIINSGEAILFYVHYSHNITGDPISGASLIVKNYSSGTTWPTPFQILREFSNGTYKIEISSFGLKGGDYYFSINFSKSYYISSEIGNYKVTIGGGVSNINITAPGCLGLSYYNECCSIVDPIPYYNSTMKLRIYYYSNMTLEPLSNGYISGSWIGGGPAISWAPDFFGYYNITLDLSGFNSESNYTLQITIQQMGYDAAELYIIVPIKKLPTRIDSLEANYSGYLEESITILAIFQDTYNDQSIPSIYDLNGNFTIKIGNVIDNMSLIVPNLGLYEYTVSISSLGLQVNNTYNITLYAYSSEHEFAIINVSFYIIPKSFVNLSLIYIPDTLLAGEQFKVSVLLSNLNGSILPNIPINFKLIYQPGDLEVNKNGITNQSGISELDSIGNPFMTSVQIIIEFPGNEYFENQIIYSPIIPIIKLNSNLIINKLPAEIMQGDNLEVEVVLYINNTVAINKIIIFEFYYDDSSIPNAIKSSATDTNGIANVILNVLNGISRISITASYNGSTSVIGNNSATELSVISIGTLIIRFSPFWITGIIIGAVAVLLYEFQYRRPNRERQNKQNKQIKQKFDDINSLVYFIISDKRSGVPLFQHSVKASELNPVLVSGFLQAISTFKDQLAYKKEVATEGGWTLDYENFKINGFNGQFTFLAVISSHKLSDEIKKRLNELLSEFEKKYKTNLEHFDGKTKRFRPVYIMIRTILDLDLISAQRVNTLKLDLPELNKPDAALIKLSKSVEKENGHFHILKLAQTAASARGESKLKILRKYYKLWKKGYFITKEIEDN